MRQRLLRDSVRTESGPGRRGVGVVDGPASRQAMSGEPSYHCLRWESELQPYSLEEMLALLLSARVSRNQYSRMLD